MQYYPKFVVSFVDEHAFSPGSPCTMNVVGSNSTNARMDVKINSTQLFKKQTWNNKIIIVIIRHN